jgi:hypothetical protein
MARGHGHVVEEAEAHGLVARGMVARRPHGAEGVAARPAITSSVAATAAPAARSAACQVAGRPRCRGPAPWPTAVAHLRPAGPELGHVAGVWARSSCSRVASGASRKSSAMSSPVASRWSAMASRRCGHSGWPGPMSCRRQSAVAVEAGAQAGPGLSSWLVEGGFRLWSRDGHEPTRQLSRLVDQISTIIVGKRPQIEDCVACLLAGGHLLIEDVPGVGKTTLAHALAVSLGCTSRACSSPPT